MTMTKVAIVLLLLAMCSSGRVAENLTLTMKSCEASNTSFTVMDDEKNYNFHMIIRVQP